MFDDFIVYLDFDGVLIDSEERIVRMKEERPDLTWDEFFATIDWNKLYSESEEINEAIRIIRQLQQERENLFISSKIHTLEEGQAKIRYLRNKEIYIPTLLVPPHVRKSEICIPNPKKVLIDDSKKNIRDWIDNNGVGLLFDGTAETNSTEKVKSLHFLLRG